MGLSAFFCVMIASLRLQGSLTDYAANEKKLEWVFDIKNAITTQNQTFKQNFGSGAHRYHYDISAIHNYEYLVRSSDDITMGCYGWQDETEKWHSYNYVADSHGYRFVNDISQPVEVYPTYDAHSTRSFIEDVPQCLAFKIDNKAAPLHVLTNRDPSLFPGPVKVHDDHIPHGSEQVHHVIELATPGISVHFAGTKPGDRTSTGLPKAPGVTQSAFAKIPQESTKIHPENVHLGFTGAPQDVGLSIGDRKISHTAQPGDSQTHLTSGGFTGITSVDSHTKVPYIAPPRGTPTPSSFRPSEPVFDKPRPTIPGGTPTPSSFRPTEPAFGKPTPTTAYVLNGISSGDRLTKLPQVAQPGGTLTVSSESVFGGSPPPTNIPFGFTGIPQDDGLLIGHTNVPQIEDSTTPSRRRPNELVFGKPGHPVSDGLTGITPGDRQAKVPYTITPSSPHPGDSVIGKPTPSTPDGFSGIPSGDRDTNIPYIAPPGGTPTPSSPLPSESVVGKPRPPTSGGFTGVTSVDSHSKTPYIAASRGTPTPSSPRPSEPVFGKPTPSTADGFTGIPSGDRDTNIPYIAPPGGTPTPSSPLPSESVVGKPRPPTSGGFTGFTSVDSHTKIPVISPPKGTPTPSSPRPSEPVFGKPTPSTADGFTGVPSGDRDTNIPYIVPPGGTPTPSSPLPSESVSGQPRPPTSGGFTGVTSVDSHSKTPYIAPSRGTPTPSSPRPSEPVFGKPVSSPSPSESVFGGSTHPTNILSDFTGIPADDQVLIGHTNVPHTGDSTTPSSPRPNELVLGKPGHAISDSFTGITKGDRHEKISYTATPSSPRPSQHAFGKPTPPTADVFNGITSSDKHIASHGGTATPTVPSPREPVFGKVSSIPPYVVSKPGPSTSVPPGFTGITSDDGLPIGAHSGYTPTPITPLDIPAPTSHHPSGSIVVEIPTILPYVSHTPSTLGSRRPEGSPISKRPLEGTTPSLLRPYDSTGSHTTAGHDRVVTYLPPPTTPLTHRATETPQYLKTPDEAGEYCKCSCPRV